MKELFEQVIQRREYDLKSLLTCIDQYHIEGKLTDDERQELTQAAREGATADYDYRCPCGIAGRTRCTRRKSTGNGRWRERLNPDGGYRNGWRTRTPFRLFR